MSKQYLAILVILQALASLVVGCQNSAIPGPPDLVGFIKEGQENIYCRD